MALQRATFLFIYYMSNGLAYKILHANHMKIG